MSIEKDLGVTAQAIKESIEDRHRYPEQCGGFYLIGLTSMLTTTRTLFPEEFKSPDFDRDNTLSKAYYLLPIMISCNDWCDFGSRLTRKDFTLRSAKNNNLIYVQNSLGELARAHQSDQKFLKLVASYVDDMLRMSKFKDELTPDQHKKYLEIDSMIFIAASLGAIVPNIQEQTKFNPEIIPSSFEEMTEKYSPLFQNPKINALHSLEMILKVEDDMRVSNFDDVFRNPSFDPTRAKENIEIYLREVMDSDIPISLKAFALFMAKGPNSRGVIAGNFIKNRKFKNMSAEVALNEALSGRATVRTVFQYNEALLDHVREKNF